MGKNKKAKNSGLIVVIAVLLVILLVLLAIFVIPQTLYRLRGGDSAEFPESSQTEPSTEPSTETKPQTVYHADDALAFPLTLDGGNLEVEELFSFDGVNPDGSMEDIKDIASITLKNNSEKYLESAVISAILSDGTECSFAVTDLPSGMSTMTFATGDETLQKGVFCVDLSVEAVYADIPAWDQVSVSVAGTTVTVQNISDKDLSNIDVYCHDSFGESYFGGITYKYTINELPVNQTAEFDVSESFLGMVDVVRITINDEK